MILTSESIKELEEASKPLIKFLCDNCHPHVTVIVTPDGAEMVEGIATIKVTEFIKD